MGIMNDPDEDYIQEINNNLIQSFSKPYSPSFYLNNKIFDKNITIQSVIEEALKGVEISKEKEPEEKEKIAKI